MSGCAKVNIPRISVAYDNKGLFLPCAKSSLEWATNQGNSFPYNDSDPGSFHLIALSTFVVPAKGKKKLLRMYTCY